MKLIHLIFGLVVAGISFQLYQQKPLQQSINDGEEIYMDFCLQCHQQNGKGVSGVFPPLAQSDYLLSDVNRSISAIKYGLKGSIIVNGKNYNSVMVSQGLDNEEIADVMNYILHSWGNESEENVTQERVESILKK